MQLAQNWRDILKRAWSVRFMALAAFFSGMEVAVPYLDGTLPLSRIEFSLLAASSTLAAFVSRLIAQKDLED